MIQPKELIMLRYESSLESCLYRTDYSLFDLVILNDAPITRTTPKPNLFFPNFHVTNVKPSDPHLQNQLVPMQMYMANLQWNRASIALLNFVILSHVLMTRTTYQDFSDFLSTKRETV
ncbi:hypothetical protein AVEN_177560-1 [Araneus ventricosus]|uniref:Uncharacterized protein n=1 Tax=Araneus ventricosus TaxID=182803 RepID=A0A4Y2QRN6_ARAVE|nr:hypothetical protein AVEN_177560-1 [Araneus ventricosus]